MKGRKLAKTVGTPVVLSSFPLGGETVRNGMGISLREKIRSAKIRRFPRLGEELAVGACQGGPGPDVLCVPPSL